MSWHEMTLGEAIHVKHGFAFKSQYFSDSGDFVVLTPGNFNEKGGFRVRLSKDRLYAGDLPEEYVLNGGDIIVAMTEQGPGLLGSSAVVPESGKYLHNQRLGLIQDIDEKVLDKNFLYYLFNTRRVRGQISGSATGTKVRHTAPERIYQVKVVVPTDVNQQRKIASILMAYDDLIENNRMRIRLLEKAARMVYKEWFVDLRFPGHEQVRIKDGVPEGWKRRTLSDVLVELESGARPKGGAKQEGIPSIGAENVVETAINESEGSTPSGLFVVDSVRTEGQIQGIRDAYGTNVHHIHVTADQVELKCRYVKRETNLKTPIPYEQAKRNKTERNIEKLEKIADIVVSTDRCTEDAVLVRATALLNLYPRCSTDLVDVIVGGQYGSEGKGNIVGHIAPEYELLVRVGGPNAGHKVFAVPEAEAYFHLPSGTRRAPSAKLLLGAGAVIYPNKLLKEIAECQVEVGRLTIDPQAMVIDNEDQERERKTLGSIGSTAQGVGFASARKITGRGDYQNGTGFKLAKDVAELHPYLKESQSILEDCFVEGKRILLEGTQGTSLSIHHGCYPHVTSRDTTVAGCLSDSGIAPSNVNRVIMVCRTYPIRVGGPSGPIGIELSYDKLAARSGIEVAELKKNERTTTTNRQRRFAEFDWAQFRRSVQLNGPSDIALTFADYLSISNRAAYRVEQLTEDTLRFIEELERVSGRPVSIISTAFDWRNIIDRRNW